MSSWIHFEDEGLMLNLEQARKIQLGPEDASILIDFGDGGGVIELTRERGSKKAFNTFIDAIRKWVEEKHIKMDDCSLKTGA